MLLVIHDTRMHDSVVPTSNVRELGMNYVFVFSSCENLDRIVIPAKKAISDIFQNFDWRHLNDRKLQMFKARNNIFVTGRNCNQFFFAKQLLCY